MNFKELISTKYKSTIYYQILSDGTAMQTGWNFQFYSLFNNIPELWNLRLTQEFKANMIVQKNWTTTDKHKRRKVGPDTPIGAILTFLHSVTPKLTLVTPQWISILPDFRQVCVPSFKLVALILF